MRKNKLEHRQMSILVINTLGGLIFGQNNEAFQRIEKARNTLGFQQFPQYGGQDAAILIVGHVNWTIQPSECLK